LWTNRRPTRQQVQTNRRPTQQQGQTHTKHTTACSTCTRPKSFVPTFGGQIERTCLGSSAGCCLHWEWLFSSPGTGPTPGISLFQHLKKRLSYIHSDSLSMSNCSHIFPRLIFIHNSLGTQCQQVTSVCEPNCLPTPT